MLNRVLGAAALVSLLVAQPILAQQTNGAAYMRLNHNNLSPLLLPGVEEEEEPAAPVAPVVTYQALQPLEQGWTAEWALSADKDVTWSVVQAPYWLSLSEKAARTVKLRGMPPNRTPFSVTLRATPSEGPYADVEIGPLTPEAQNPFSAYGFNIGAQARTEIHPLQLTVQGGRAPFRWEFEDSGLKTLPHRVSVSPTGLVTGQLFMAGSMTYRTRVYDSSVPPKSISQVVSFVVSDTLPLSFSYELSTSNIVYQGRVGEPGVWAQRLTPKNAFEGHKFGNVGGGAEVLEYPGLTYDPDTGVISGIPTTQTGSNSYVQSFIFDGLGRYAFNNNKVWVTGAQPELLPRPVYTAHVGPSFNFKIPTKNVVGGKFAVGPASCAVVGTRPPGLQLSADCTIAGWASAAALGDHPVTLRMTDGDGKQATASFILRYVDGAQPRTMADYRYDSVYGGLSMPIDFGTDVGTGVQMLHDDDPATGRQSHPYLAGKIDLTINKTNGIQANGLRITADKPFTYVLKSGSTVLAQGQGAAGSNSFTTTDWTAASASLSVTSTDGSVIFISELGLGFGGVFSR